MIPSPIVSCLSTTPGPADVVTPSEPPKAAPSAAPAAAISSSAWKVRTPNALWRASSSRIELAGVIGYAPRKRSSPESLRGGDQPVGERGVAGDLPVGARRELRRRDLVADREVLRGLAVGVARLERGRVRLRDLGPLRELPLDELERPIGRPVVEPAHQPEREEVLRALRFAGRDPLDPLQGAHGHRREPDLVDVEVVERAVLERVGLVAGLLQVALLERVGVDDQRAALRQVADVRLQRRGVHRHEDVRRVTGGEDVVVGEMELEARDTRERAGRARGSRRGSPGASRGRSRAWRSRS